MAATPGTAFECDGYLRLSYSVPVEDIEAGLDRIEEFLGRLR